MRMLLLIVGGLCLLAACASRDAGDTTDAGIRCTVIEYVDTFYAVWGEREDGSPFEDRYSAIRVRLELPGGAREVYFTEHWFDGSGKEYPPAGASFAIAELPANKSPLGLVDREHYYFDDLKITSD